MHPFDWLAIGLYLCVALAAGLLASGKARTDRRNYFLAGGSIPWWWAGLSIAATTFAADTPLAITGIVAAKGLSGNWLWLAAMGLHAAVVVLFAAFWNRSGVLTDAELIAMRYSGRAAGYLRTFRAILYGVVINGIVLGWVLRAMSKIVAPYFQWDAWLPQVTTGMSAHWPAGSPLGTPSEALTIVALLALVALYSSLGGLRGVILTDLLQIVLALGGSLWLAIAAWRAVGGRSGLLEGLSALYGADHRYLDLFPATGAGWLAGVGVGAFTFGLYLIVQATAGSPADGGGYLMQRLNSTPDPKQARLAALVFLLIHYGLRIWPWFIVSLAALVLIPLGQEAGSLGGAGAPVAGDRELAYPVLMGHLLGPGVLGIVVASLLAAFMSTVDTHINWGASYMVNDVLLRLRPQAGDREQIRVARFSVVGFAVLGVLICSRIDSIEQAWQWVAALGAALAAPTCLRWLWWRVNATSELAAMICGLGAAIVFGAFTPWPYEVRLILICGASVAGMLAGIAAGPRTDPETLRRFAQTVRPVGFWPGAGHEAGGAALVAVGLRWLALVGGLTLLLVGVHRALLAGGGIAGTIAVGAGVAFIWIGSGGRLHPGGSATSISDPSDASTREPVGDLRYR